MSRIFRELVSNIIRHSGATLVVFEVVPQGAGCMFALRDNGKGLMPGQTDGNGLQNLRARAEELGADIHWHNRVEGGVEVSLVLGQAPLSPIAAAP